MPASTSCDLLIIGGGINGTAIARDAAGRGLRVVLCEQDDLAGATSSASSKLIHGGLRYLEQFHVRLVREALTEREILLNSAAHLVVPLRFCLPHNNLLRPAWMIRVGLFLYDHLGLHRRLGRSRGVDLRRDGLGAPLQEGFRRGFTYWDCRVDDSRLVIANALDAARRGGTILTRTRFAGARRKGQRWSAQLEPVQVGEPLTVDAGAIVNTGGPWAQQVLEGVLGQPAPYRLQLVRGSHLVVPRLHANDAAYLLQNTDGRVIFVIPYLEHYSLIGTTDVPCEGAPGQVRMAPAEALYLCEVVNRYFRTRVSPGDAVWSFAGVRPLVGEEARNPSKVSRDYVLALDAPRGQAPFLTVFGGKLTTQRRLAERVLKTLRKHLAPAGPPWTADAPLPGGDFGPGGPGGYEAGLRAGHPWLPAPLAHRYVMAYGTAAERLLGDATSLAALGRDFGGGLTEREVVYLQEEEWARTAADILWRRGKLGLRLNAAETGALSEWLAKRRPPAPAPAVC